MAERTLKVTAENGLHAQASAKVVQTLSHFGCNVSFSLGGREVNAKSIMGVMLLAAGPGREILARADGDDAEQALDALQQLFESRFGD
ncbi:phosphocarrier protein HPr [Arenimonas maotaiensis]|uniref:Phosphocarrier protein HPr n=1 Tax=Arenimonas maotaiensis TaxID=1446479 RepID=A0A917CEI4_9GAMM|nr:HPr family phosphocarrier protein [Arenimonas maotaiensis]GGF86554.1 phosphocarrier protein HPr [Arenimonas maotaiensis]